VTKKLSIDDLAVQAGVTKRTIRYYTSEGLLPEPVKDKEGSRYCYTQEHVERLELIRRLKLRYLPLQEIKRILALTAPEDVSNLLGMQDTLSSAKPEAPARPQMFREKSSAKDYIEDLFSNPEWDPNQGSIPTRGHHKTPPASPMPAPAPQTGRETWAHIDLAPGIELHVLEGLDPETKRLVEKLVQYALKLLENKRGTQ
jgi:DNA-binding transcriptional MerR regulator